ncbi:hypothetical protein PIROE2DRAFT_14228 [Piromyces sp. E2]|nr:hypothetical protein PIROE2DRAFT_14228 [Piromyces sp. E2]|eukprot:OUM60102.1 hypothetical protein PIROE2DRAFT_14228 [Piromyces sp. E2]
MGYLLKDPKVNEENREIISEGFYEQNIAVQYISSNNEYTKCTEISDKKWELKINKSGEYINLDIKNIDVDNDAFIHISSKIIVYVRNIYDINYYRYIDLYDNVNNNNILEYNKCIIGVYIRLYKYEEKDFLEEMKKIKERKDSNFRVKNGSFEWIMNKKVFIDKNVFSPKFRIGNQECLLKIDADKNKVTVKIIDFNTGSVINNLKCRSSIYIRKYSDFSYYSCVDKVNFTIDISLKSQNHILEKDKCVIGIYLQYVYYIKDQRIPEYEGSFEWKIENWNQLSHVEISPEFVIANHKWILELYPQDTNEFNLDFVSVRLKNVDDIFDYFTHIYLKKIIYIRNCYDYNCYYLKERGRNKKPLIENNKCIVGIYISVYKNEEGQYIDELTNSINNKYHEIQRNGLYEWKIENWNQIFYEERSPIFKIDNYRW